MNGGLLACMMVAVLVASGASVALDRRYGRQRQAPVSDAPVEPGEAEATGAADGISRQLTQALALSRQWQLLLAEIQGHLSRATTVEQVIAACARAWKAEFPKAGFMLALGTPDQMLLSQSVTQRLQIATLPGLKYEVAELHARDIFALLKTPECDNKTSVFLERQNPALHREITERLLITGESLLIPLRYTGTLCGFVLIFNDALLQKGDTQRDTVTNAEMLGVMLATWYRYITPYLLASDAATGPMVLRPEVLPTLNALERLQESPEHAAVSQPLLQSYAQFVTSRVKELSLLAERACQILRRHCHADVVMLLLPHSPQAPAGAAVEAVDVEAGTWSPLRDRLGERVTHPLLAHRRDLVQWPDRFAEKLDHMTDPLFLTGAQAIQRQAERFAGLGLESLWIVPAPFYGECQAVFVIGGAATEYQDSLQAFVATLSTLVAASLGFMNVEHELQNERRISHDMARVDQRQTTQLLDGLAYIAQTRSVLLGTEPHKVAELAEAIGHELRLSRQEYQQIRMAALVCDIGMVSVPESIPRKKTPLTDIELECLRMHPKFSVKFLTGIDLFTPILPVILHHHERWDGAGYPDRLVGEEIPLSSRIIAVADAYLSMQAKRSYRAAMTADEAYAALRQGSGQQFDPMVVAALARLLGKDEEAVA